MNKFVQKALLGAFVFGVVGTAGYAHRIAALREFTLEDKKGANGFSFAMVDGLEPLYGTGNDVRGTINFDMDKPENSTGKVIIGIKSLKVTSEVMTANMMGGWCLDADKYPEATFTVKSAKVTKKDKKKMEFAGMVTGDFSVKGVTKTITVPVSARYVSGGVKERFGDIDGDLMMIRADFSFNRFDYEIGKAVKEQLLSNKVDVRINVAGMAFKK